MRDIQWNGIMLREFESLACLSDEEREVLHDWAYIEKDIQHILDNKPLTCDNLERFVLLCRAMKYMGKIRHEFTEEDAKE